MCKLNYNIGQFDKKSQTSPFKWDGGSDKLREQYIKKILAKLNKA